MSIEEVDFDVEVGELGGVDGAILEDPVVDESTAFGDGSDDRKEGEVVDIEAGEGHGVDLVDGGDEIGFFDVKVDETGAIVGGEVFGGFVDVGMHAF